MAVLIHQVHEVQIHEITVEEALENLRIDVHPIDVILIQILLHFFHVSRHHAQHLEALGLICLVGFREFVGIAALGRGIVVEQRQDIVLIDICCREMVTVNVCHIQYRGGDVRHRQIPSLRNDIVPQLRESRMVDNSLWHLPTEIVSSDANEKRFAHQIADIGRNRPCQIVLANLKTVKVRQVEKGCRYFTR